jgi:membrane associated rhomboid family serine protease
VAWREIGDLPSRADDDWRAIRGRRAIVGDVAVDRELSRWQPLDSLLVAEPGSRHFLPVPQLECFDTKVHPGLKRRYLTATCILCAILILFVFAGYNTGGDRWWRSALALVLVIVFISVDYVLIIRDRDALADRALFSWRVQAAARGDIAFWGVAMISAGLLQMYGQTRLGGFEPLVRMLGVTFEEVRNGEYWRLLLGPFLHGSIAHWAGNLALLILVGSVAGTVSRPRAVAVFLTGTSLSAAAATVLSYGQFDSYVGVSGGINALFGWCAGLSARQPAWFPKGFLVTAVAFAFLNIGIASALSDSASWVGHVAGFAVGLCLGLLFKCHLT